MTDLGFLDSTRSSYDAVATGYSALFVDQLAREPVLRSMLTLFAELAAGSAAGRAADVGCGPGHVTAFLHRQGLDAFGIDLSPGMVTQAQHADEEAGSISDRPEAGPTRRPPTMAFQPWPTLA